MIKIKMSDKTICYSTLDLIEFNGLINSDTMLVCVYGENFEKFTVNKYQIVSIKEV